MAVRPRGSDQGTPQAGGGRRRLVLACLGVAGVLLAAVVDQYLSVRTGRGLDPPALVFVAFPIVGALIAARQPRNAIGWIMVGIGIAIVVSTGLRGYAYYALAVRPGALPGAGFALAVEQLLWIPAVGLPGTFLLLLFPDGRPPSARWRAWGHFSAVALVASFALLAVVPTSFGESGYPGVRNPLGIDALEPHAGTIVLVVALIPIAMVGCAVALIQRFRRSHGTARVQLKWLAAAAGFVATTYLVLMAIHVLFDDGRMPPWLDVATDLGIGAFVLIPVAVGVAVLRYRLYEIDVILNRTLVYGGLTATLSAAYFVVVATLQGLLRPFAGHSRLAVAGSTLVVAAAFRPARVRIQTFVDRRFYRSKFDADATLARFSARVREGVDLETLSADLLTAVDETLRPATASLWLRPKPPR